MIFRVLANGPIAEGIYRMRLEKPAPSQPDRPGRFLHIRIPGFYLRRPISIALQGEDTCDIVYRLVGEGTKRLAAMGRGARLDALGPLGNGFSLARAGDRPALIGGGVGVPPLLDLARALIESGRRPEALLGFSTAREALLVRDFERLGIQPRIATMDGSAGKKGLVTDLLGDLGADSFYACGPEGMLRAVLRACDLPGEVSLEARMACGIGACMGCTIVTRRGPMRVCSDGPVFDREVLPW